MNEKEFFEAAFDNCRFNNRCLCLSAEFVNTLLEVNFKLKSQKVSFPADTQLLKTYILFPRTDLCKRFYLAKYLHCESKEDFINDLLNEKDSYPSYIIYLFESNGKHFFVDGELNFINRISDEVLQSDSYDISWFGSVYDEDILLSDSCPICYCEAFDNKVYAVQPTQPNDMKAVTSDFMKQILKMTADYAEFCGITDISTVIKHIIYQYDKLFFGKAEDEVLNTKLYKLTHISPHTLHYIFHNGAKTIGEMLKLTDDELSQIPELFETNVEEVKQTQKDVTELLEFCKTRQMSENQLQLS